MHVTFFLEIEVSIIGIHAILGRSNLFIMKMQLAEIAKALNSSVNMGEDKVITSVVF